MSNNEPRTGTPEQATQPATVLGGGAIAPGVGATAVGERGIVVGGNNSGTINNGNLTNINSGGGPVIINQFAENAAPRTQFQAPGLELDHVRRAAELDVLKEHLLDAAGMLQRTTVVVHGFGGLGKTTLARSLCAEPEVLRACADGILWVELGQNPPDQHALITDLVVALTGSKDGCATLSSARGQLQTALGGRKLLFVIDDVWDAALASSLFDASSGCARLITTRHAAIRPPGAVMMDVGKMSLSDAQSLLAFDLPPGEPARIAQLAEQLGRWPILLRLTNRTLWQLVEQNTPLADALDSVERDFAQLGVVAFDPEVESQPRDDQAEAAWRNRAVAASIEASLKLLSAAECQRYAELAIFPKDMPIPSVQAAALWRITGAVDAIQSERLITRRLHPASLLVYDGAAKTLRLHDVPRAYLSAKLADQAELHQRLSAHWGDRPQQADVYAWRWLAYHRAQAAILSEKSVRHQRAAELVALVRDDGWQRTHEAVTQDLPALRQALLQALHAAIADDTASGVALVVQAADTLVHFNREHARAEPIFALAQQGDLEGAKRRSTLFAVDEHWRQALLLTIAWLAPPEKLDEARKLCTEVRAQLSNYPPLHNLRAWVESDLLQLPAPQFPYLVKKEAASEELIEEIVKRVGGSKYNRSLMHAQGLDPQGDNPYSPTEGLYRGRVPGVDATDAKAERTTTRYLADLDGPYLVAYAADEPTKASDALARYLSVYTNYNYPEYRFSTLWLLVDYMVQLPRADGAAWVRHAVVQILTSALGGPSVEFEQGVAIATTALRARLQDQAAHNALAHATHQLLDEAMRLKPGRDRDGSDIWGHHKRLMLTHAQVIGWLLGEHATAKDILDHTLALGESGFAGFQAPACLALAEALTVCSRGAPDARIQQAQELAQRAAHNVQDPTFCARMTARVNAMRTKWSSGFDVEARVRQLGQAAQLPELAALHCVGHDYQGRRADALELPAWAREDNSFDALEKLYQRSKADFLRLNGAERKLAKPDKIAVPDPGLLPHLAARVAAEILAQAGDAPLSAERVGLLRQLVPHAVISPTALDAVLTRLVLAQARNDPQAELAAALQQALTLRPQPELPSVNGELLTAANYSRLPA